MNSLPRTVLKEFSIEIETDDAIRVCLEDSRLVRELLDDINDIRLQLEDESERIIYLTRA